MVHRSQFVIFRFLQGKVVWFGKRFHIACLVRVYLCQKKLSFGCVCSMKMGLLKRVSPVLFHEKELI